MLERVLSGLSVREQRQATELLRRLGRRAAEPELEDSLAS